MKEQYFIQQFARRMLERVPDAPNESFIWSNDFLGSLTSDKFYQGICTFNEIIKSILIDVQENPQSWGMLCFETKDFACNAPRIREETKTTKELLRIGHLFYALGMNGDLIGQSFLVNKAKFNSYKVSKVKILFEKLQEFGFVLVDYNTKSEKFEISYPDENSVLQVIKAYSLLPNSNISEILALILRAEWRYFDDNKGKNFTFDINDFYRGLSNTDIEVVKSFYDISKNYGYDYTVMDTGGLQFEPKCKKDKKRLIYIKRERDELSFNLRCDYINNYVNEFIDASENVKIRIINNFIRFSCSYCNRAKCPGGTLLVYNGNIYTKCIMSGCFNFNRINETDAQSILKLFECEIKNRVRIAK